MLLFGLTLSVIGLSDPGVGKKKERSLSPRP